MFPVLTITRGADYVCSLLWRHTLCAHYSEDTHSLLCGHALLVLTIMGSFAPCGHYYGGTLTRGHYYGDKGPLVLTIMGGGTVGR